ncbi:28S ribosomal protein S9, mitochondrial [Ischnura elegans]|uniref:28S ribosomal protein S9, mitochondrial n=1 Tax=Ischnura elegans TaxID=197161 RepID=UPI001ED8AE11|nr:28S ribosomal protein S9, mitochondrial [Ischnura elegans]
MTAALGLRILRLSRAEKQVGKLIRPVACPAHCPFSNDASSEPHEGRKTISKAMRLYLERSREYDEFMKKEKINFSVGKRHLANMMGEDPETFTQEDINNAIEYLFPSGLFEPRARPIMKPPEEVYPEKKAAEFDESGRPHHSLFYTGNPNYYQQLFDIASMMESLNKHEDEQILKKQYPSKESQMDLSGSEWLPKENLEKLLLETINDREYANFIKAMERLVRHPYSYRVKDHVFKFRKLLMNQTKVEDIPKPEIREDGKSVVNVTGAIRKTAVAEATLTYPGSGTIRINGKDILYFDNIQSREQVLFPLIFTGLVDQIDVDATVRGGGVTSQAGAVRWAIAWGLRSFVSSDTVEKMRLAGLLTKDLRRKERKKPGQEGARRKYTWKKR